MTTTVDSATLVVAELTQGDTGSKEAAEASQGTTEASKAVPKQDMTPHTEEKAKDETPTEEKGMDEQPVKPVDTPGTGAGKKGKYKGRDLSKGKGKDKKGKGKDQGQSQNYQNYGQQMWKQGGAGYGQNHYSQQGYEGKGYRGCGGGKGRKGDVTQEQEQMLAYNLYLQQLQAWQWQQMQYAAAMQQQLGQAYMYNAALAAQYQQPLVDQTVGSTLAPTAAPFIPNQEFQGSLKSISTKNGFGFIVCKETHDLYGRDVYVEASKVPENAKVLDRLSFTVSLSEKGHPRAENTRIVSSASIPPPK